MDSEIYEKAHEIMRARRTKARDENERRIQEINQKIPEIKEINNALFNTGSEILKAIANGSGKDVTAEIERIKENNIKMQNVAKQLLVSHGYPPDYLDVHYSCSECDDTGYTDYKFCDCMKQVFGKLRSEEFSRNTYLELSDFESFSLKYYSGNDYHTMKKILDFTRNYAETFTLGANGIMMFGGTGLGKTHLSLAIAGRVIQRGFAVVYDSVINILDNIENEHFSYERSRQTLDAVLDTDLLILDDLGTEQESKFFKSTIYNIINTRINRRKSTIISTNLNLGDIEKRYDIRIVSRLSAYTQMRFSGTDVRLQMRREQLENNKNYR